MSSAGFAVQIFRRLENEDLRMLQVIQGSAFSFTDYFQSSLTYHLQTPKKDNTTKKSRKRFCVNPDLTRSLSCSTRKLS